MDEGDRGTEGWAGRAVVLTREGCAGDLMLCHVAAGCGLVCSIGPTSMTA